MRHRPQVGDGSPVALILSPGSHRAGLVGAALACVVLLAGCGREDAEDPNADGSDPTERLPAQYKKQEPVPQPDFSDAAKASTFQQAIRYAATLLGAEPQALKSPMEAGDVKGGVSFDVPQDKVSKLLRNAHADFLAKGFYLFRYDQNFGIGGSPDKVGLLPTSDKYAVIAAMGTNGVNYNIGTDGVIAWLKDLEREQPFVLTGIGMDYVEGHFTRPVKDRKALARRMYEFCPDIVEQGVGTVGKLEDELRNGTLYFWWD